MVRPSERVLAPRATSDDAPTIIRAAEQRERYE